MRFTAFDFRKYGRFDGKSFPIPEKPQLAIIYGLNEAGKTTMLRGITDFLFGIRGTQSAFVHQPNQLRIGVTIAFPDSTTKTFYRRNGRLNSLRDEYDKEPVDEQILNSLIAGLGGDRNLFTSMFGLDHDTMASGGRELAEGNGDLQAALVAATGVVELKNMLSTLSDGYRNLFLPTGKKLINQKLTTLREFEQAALSGRLDATEWSEIDRKYRSSIHKVSDIDRQLVELEQEGNLVTALSEARVVADQLSGADIELRRLTQDLAGLSLDISVLTEDDAAKITELHRQVLMYQTYVDKVPEIKAAVEALEEDALSELRKIVTDAADLEFAAHYAFPQPTRDTVQSLISRRADLEQRLAECNKDLRRSESESERITGELAGLGETGDYRSLEGALIAAQGDRNLERVLETHRQELSAAQGKLGSYLSALPLWNDGDVEKLANAAVPLHETIRGYSQEYKSMREKLGSLEQLLNQDDEDLARIEATLGETQSNGQSPNEDDLANARAHRDAGWQLIRARLVSGEHDPEAERQFSEDPIEDAYEVSVKSSDATADMLLLSAEAMGRASALSEQYNEIIERRKQHSAQLDSLEPDRQKLETRWQAAWAETGISPLSPDEMTEWIKAREEILRLREEAQKALTAITATERLIDGHRIRLGAELVALEQPGPGQSEALDALVDRAAATCNRLKEANIRISEKTELLVSTNVSLEEAKREQYRLLRQIRKHWTNEWSRSMENIGQPRETPPEVASSFLEITGALAELLSNLQRKRDELDTAEDFIRQFRSDTLDIAKRAAHDLIPRATVNPADAVEALNQVYTDILRGQDEIRRQEQTKAGFLTQFNSCKEELKRMIPQTRQELLRGLLSDEIGAASDYVVDDELLNRVTNSLDLERLRAERERLDQRMVALRKDMEEANQELGAAREIYDRTVQAADSSAEAAEQNSEIVVSEIRAAAVDYMRLRLAHAVLQEGISRYTETNQRQIIERAGDIFRRITLGSFEGLDVDYDANPNGVLRGRRPNDEIVDLSGMSDGTEDQLYLALRLATIQCYLQQSQPVPLILDDICIKFDNKRSAETFKVLSELSEQTQVLFFTHNQHLCDVAREVLNGSVEVVDI